MDGGIRFCLLFLTLYIALIFFFFFFPLLFLSLCLVTYRNGIGIRFAAL